MKERKKFALCCRFQIILTIERKENCLLSRQYWIDYWQVMMTGKILFSKKNKRKYIIKELVMLWFIQWNEGARIKNIKYCIQENICYLFFHLHLFIIWIMISLVKYIIFCYYLIFSFLEKEFHKENFLIQLFIYFEIYRWIKVSLINLETYKSQTTYIFKY